MSDLIPDEIQKSILDKVSSPRDQARLSVVCKFWNSIYKENTFHWFVLTDHDKENHTRGFCCLCDGKIYRLTVPELEDKFICGSSHGWLITVDDSRVLYLYDPFAKVQIQLSPLPLGQNQSCFMERSDGGCDIRKVILSCDPRKKPNECMILCIDAVYGVYFCKFEDKKWIKFPLISQGHGNETDDVIFYKGNFILVHYSQVFACHLGPEPKFTPYGPEITEKLEFAYLVNIQGNLALVNKYFGLMNPEPMNIYDEFLFGLNDEPKPKPHFDVYKLDEDKGWRKENDIGDQVLLLGSKEAKALPASSVPNAVGNYIYHGDRYVELFFGGYSMDKGIFNLKEWKTVLLYPRDEFDDMTLSPPIWLLQK